MYFIIYGNKMNQNVLIISAYLRSSFSLYYGLQDNENVLIMAGKRERVNEIIFIM